MIVDTLPTGNIDNFTGQSFHADALELLRALPDKSCDMILTDFPYQVTQAHYDQMELDLVAIGLEMFRVIKRDAAVISTAAQPFTSKLVMAWSKYFRYEWIWKKTRTTNFLNAKKMPLAGHESILVFGHKLPNYYPQMFVGNNHKRGWIGDRGTILYGSFGDTMEMSNEYYPNSILEFAHDAKLSITKTQKPNKQVNHPNQKPLALFEYLIRTYSLEGQIILDPFCGSGTTAIAARNLGRQFIAGDITQEYVELARTRLANTDPYQDSTFKNGQKQLSLFRDTKD